MRLLAIFPVFAALIAPSPVAAWHKGGHMAIARIAWQDLTREGQQATAINILQSHPHKAIFLEADRPSDVDGSEWLFVRAATWPDWVGNPSGKEIGPQEATAISQKYHRPEWHFVNLPFVHPDEIDKFDEAAIRKDVLQPDFTADGAPRHALAALKRSLQQLESRTSSPEDRAVALCWVLHLVGDLHQPLHGVALIGSKAKFNPQEFLPPQGDLGGNRLAVRIKVNDTNAMALHKFWDGLCFADQPYPDVQARVLSWMNEPTLQRATFNAALGELNPLDWTLESWMLAKSVAYKGSNGLLAAIPLPPNHKPADLIGLNAPLLPQEYMRAAEEAAQRRIVLAGYRLADQLGNVWRESRRN